MFKSKVIFPVIMMRINNLKSIIRSIKRLFKIYMHLIKCLILYLIYFYKSSPMFMFNTKVIGLILNHIQTKTKSIIRINSNRVNIWNKAHLVLLMKNLYKAIIWKRHLELIVKLIYYNNIKTQLLKLSNKIPLYKHNK